MDLHCECNEISASEQQSGKISRTAFKLFGRRKSGGTMPNIFSMKNKGDGKSSLKMGLVRSKTHDGIADMGLEISKKDDSLSNYQLDNDSSTKIASSMSFAAGGCGSIAKSHSFFSLLKRNSKLENCKGESIYSNSDQMKEKSCNRQKKGLKGLFSSMRWHRKDKVNKGGKAEHHEIPDFITLPGSLTASLECVKEEAHKFYPESESAGMGMQDKDSCEIQGTDENASTEDPEQAIGKTSLPELHHYVENTAFDSHTSDRCANGKTSEKVEDKQDENLRNVTQDAQEGCTSTSCHLPETTTSGALNNDPPAEQSIDGICIMFSDVTSLKSFDSLTGCGDVIVDQDEDGNASEGGGAAEKVKSSGRKSTNILSYQGGGEEMASPDEVDDEYLQEFWDSPPPVTEPLKEKQEHDVTNQTELGEATCLNQAGSSSLVKQLSLNYIPLNKNDNEKLSTTKCEQQESVPNSDEGYWDSTTPGHEDENGKTLATKASIPRDSCSGDALYDLLTDPEESLTSIVSDEEMCSVSEPKTLSPKAVSPAFNITTFSKDRNTSAIPRHKTTLSIRQGEANHIQCSQTFQQLLGCEPTRTKIPIAKTSTSRPNSKSITRMSAKASTNKGSTKK